MRVAVTPREEEKPAIDDLTIIREQLRDYFINNCHHCSWSSWWFKTIIVTPTTINVRESICSVGSMQLVWNKFVLGRGRVIYIHTKLPQDLVRKSQKFQNPPEKQGLQMNLFQERKVLPVSLNHHLLVLHVISHLIPSKSIFREVFLWMFIYAVGKWKAHVRTDLVLMEGKIMIFQSFI